MEKTVRIGITCAVVVGTSFFSVSAQTNPNADVEFKIRAYFADIPVMISIAECESTFTQYKSDGTLLYDWTGTYIGAFQINERLHTQAALRMGYNIRTLEGTLAYARFLYGQNGVRPWSGCVQAKDMVSVASSSSPVMATDAVLVDLEPVSSTDKIISVPHVRASKISKNLAFGMIDEEVMEVQRILNNAGFALAQSGAGSAGNETLRFGTLTREAVKRFQCAKNITCKGDEVSTGYGKVGPQTRKALNGL